MLRWLKWCSLIELMFAFAGISRLVQYNHLRTTEQTKDNERNWHKLYRNNPTWFSFSDYFIWTISLTEICKLKIEPVIVHYLLRADSLSEIIPKAGAVSAPDLWTTERRQVSSSWSSSSTTISSLDKSLARGSSQFPTLLFAKELILPVLGGGLQQTHRVLSTLYLAMPDNFVQDLASNNTSSKHCIFNLINHHLGLFTFTQQLHPADYQPQQTVCCGVARKLSLVNRERRMERRARQPQVLIRGYLRPSSRPFTFLWIMTLTLFFLVLYIVRGQI